MVAEKTGEFALLKFLKLPPQEKWRKPGFPWSKILFDYRPSDPDGYIYYLCARTTFWLSLVLCALYYLSHLLGADISLGVFSVSALSSNPLAEMTAGIKELAPYLIFFIIIPFFTLYYRVNITPRTYDVMHGKIDPRWPRFSGLVVGAGLLLVSVINAYFPEAIFYLLFRTSSSDETSVMLISALCMSLTLTLSAYIGLYGVMAFWKNLNLP